MTKIRRSVVCFVWGETCNCAFVEFCGRSTGLHGHPNAPLGSVIVEKDGAGLLPSGIPRAS